jgi:hypothetical protein
VPGHRSNIRLLPENVFLELWNGPGRHRNTTHGPA